MNGRVNPVAGCGAGPDRWKLFFALVLLYFITSLAQFVHNAELIEDYPNLPVWITRSNVYAAWAAIAAIGVTGLLLIRHKFNRLGLATIAVYAAMGFDGLGHYSLAPMSMHTAIANLTIISEVVAAALLLLVTLYLLKAQIPLNRRRTSDV